MKHGKGARIVDLDDNVYVDYRMGYGPAILGYADERVDAAAREGMAVGGVFALATERELRVAERISKMVPAAELVRFSNSGTEAVMAGLRLARAYTGKDDYVILEGSYHGLFDAAMWFTPMDKWSQVGDPEIKPYSEGMPREHQELRPFRAGERRESVGRGLEASRRPHRLHADRAHHGQLPRDRGGA